MDFWTGTTSRKSQRRIRTATDFFNAFATDLICASLSSLRSGVLSRQESCCGVWVSVTDSCCETRTKPWRRCHRRLESRSCRHGLSESYPLKRAKNLQGELSNGSKAPDCVRTVKICYSASLDSKRRIVVNRFEPLVVDCGLFHTCLSLRERSLLGGDSALG